MGIFALRDIAVGEEVHYDYSLEYHGLSKHQVRATLLDTTCTVDCRHCLRTHPLTQRVQTEAQGSDDVYIFYFIHSLV